MERQPLNLMYVPGPLFSTPFIKKVRLLWVPVFIFLLFMYGFLVNGDVVFAFGGDVTSYLVSAQSLSEGHGYTMISFIPPEPQTRLPFLFPLVLSLVMTFFGINISLMKWTMILAYLVGLLCYADFSLRRNRPFIGLAAVLIAATHPFVLGYSQRLLSEFLYIGTSLASLWAFERAACKDKQWMPWLILAALLALLSFYTRSAGLSLVVAFVLALFLNHSLRNKIKATRISGAALVLVLLCGVLAWWLYCYKVSGAKGLYYFFEFLGLPDGSPADLDASINLKEALDRGLKNAAFYLGNIGDLAAVLFEAGPCKIAVGAVFASLAFIGFLRCIIIHRSVHELYLFFYLIVILGWNFPEPRFLMPLYVPLVFFMFEGLCFLLSRFSTLYNRLTIAAVLAAILAGNLYLQSPDYLHHKKRVGVKINENFRMVPLNKEHWNMLQLEIWIRDYMPSGGRYLVHYGNDFYLITEQRTVNYMRTNHEDTLQSLEKHRVEFVAVTEAFPAYSEWIKKGINQAPQQFMPVYTVPRTNTTLYRFVPAESLPDGH